jgi:Ca2+-binding RTX toxin-like protein
VDLHGEARSFNDPNKDGKLRAHEFDALLAAGTPNDPDNLYESGLTQETRLGAFAFIDLGTGFFSFTLFEARVNLFTLIVNDPLVPGATANFPTLATQTGSTLDLAIGDSSDHTLYIGAGAEDDQVIVSGPTHFKIFSGVEWITGTGGSGNDTIIISPDMLLPVNISGGGGVDRLIAGGGETTFDGGSGRDFIQGGPLKDMLSGGDHADIILGGEGGDEIHGGGGADRILGWRGDDDIFGDDGNDAIDGGSGNDTIEGGADDDVILGWVGNDILRGRGGADRVEGGDGADRIDGGKHDDGTEVDPDDLGDILRGGLGNDVFFRGPGADQIFGDQNNDTLDGGDDIDILDGGGASDREIGGSGDDLLIANPSNDVLDGGEGDDTYKVSFRGGRAASLTTVLDSGAITDTDVFEATGTIFADQFLLRASESVAFVALLNDPDHELGSPDFNPTAERVNYIGVERIVVNGGLGNPERRGRRRLRAGGPAVPFRAQRGPGECLG